MGLCCRKLALTAGALLFVCVSFSPSAGQTTQTVPDPQTAPAAPPAQPAPGRAPRVFLGASIGQQWMSQQVATGATIPDVFEEEATWESAFEVDDSFLFDVSGRFRVWKNLSFGIGFSRTTDSHDAELTASIPDVLEFDAHHADSRELTGLKREERAIHLSAAWTVDVTDRIDVTLMAGPSFFTVTQDFPSGITITPRESTIGSVTTGTLDSSATGFHLAADGTFQIFRNIGVGAMARYSTAKIDTPDFQDATLDVGGFQGLVGVRVRFPGSGWTSKAAPDPLTVPDPQAAPAAAAEQTAPGRAPRVFLGASIGQQWMSQQVATGASIPDVFEETATWESSFEVDDSFLFDVWGRVRVWQNLSLGIGFSRTTDSHDAELTASIPDVLEFDAHHADSRDLTGLKREERAIHLSAAWTVPVMDRVDVTLMAGPSFFTVTQDFPSGITITPRESTIGSVTTGTLDTSATGFHVAADGTFQILRNIGVGAMARYSTAKIDTPEFQDATLNVGGFQGLVGVRIRF